MYPNDPFAEPDPPCDFEMTPEVRLMFERDRLFKEAVVSVVRSELDRILSGVIAALDASHGWCDSEQSEAVAERVVRENLDRMLDAVRPPDPKPKPEPVDPRPTQTEVDQSRWLVGMDAPENLLSQAEATLDRAREFGIRGAPDRRPTKNEVDEAKAVYYENASGDVLSAAEVLNNATNFGIRYESEWS